MMPDPVQRALAAVLGVMSLPLVVVLGLGVRLESRGPDIHRAIRVGAGGQTFTCYKLRSMAVSDHEGSPLTLRNDKRLTRVGRLIRRSHLDELPQ